MNKLFFIIITVAMAILLFIDPNTILDSMISGTEKAVNLCITLLAIYVVWMGILELVSKTKLDQKLTKLLRPIIRKLFGKESEETENQISINLSSNMLGMGNASTPSGIKAMQGLDKKNGKLNKAMAMLMILNTCSIQIIPTTIIGLRASFNSLSASNIFLPTLIATSCSTLAGIVLVLLFEKIKTRKGKINNE